MGKRWTAEESAQFMPTNREKKLTPKKTGLAWCFGCDRYLLNDGNKCAICGKRHGVRRFKATKRNV
jgi:rRNA maturation endonuclease Nob1